MKWERQTLIGLKNLKLKNTLKYVNYCINLFETSFNYMTGAAALGIPENLQPCFLGLLEILKINKLIKGQGIEGDQLWLFFCGLWELFTK